ncbi:hypothetical protein C8R42DRAFT_647945 [Lentinula raphanica]|nr:hypothetical protein C8R42DRAFT_647945 [Lentinula raphanica]
MVHSPIALTVVVVGAASAVQAAPLANVPLPAETGAMDTVGVPGPAFEAPRSIILHGVSGAPSGSPISTRDLNAPELDIILDENSPEKPDGEQFPYHPQFSHNIVFETDTVERTDRLPKIFHPHSEEVEIDIELDKLRGSTRRDPNGGEELIFEFDEQHCPLAPHHSGFDHVYPHEHPVETAPIPIAVSSTPKLEKEELWMVEVSDPRHPIHIARRQETGKDETSHAPAAIGSGFNNLGNGRSTSPDVVMGETSSSSSIPHERTTRLRSSSIHEVPTHEVPNDRHTTTNRHLRSFSVPDFTRPQTFNLNIPSSDSPTASSPITTPHASPVSNTLSVNSAIPNVHNNHFISGHSASGHSASEHLTFGHHADEHNGDTDSGHGTDSNRDTDSGYESDDRSESSFGFPRRRRSMVSVSGIPSRSVSYNPNAYERRSTSFGSPYGADLD